LFIGIASDYSHYSPDMVAIACLAAALALAVNAWVSRAHWSVRALGVLCSLSFPLYVLVHGLL